MKRLYVLASLVLFASVLSAQVKSFCNLTPDDVRIDSVLPQVSYSFPLPDNYKDSVYTVQLKYPEFIDMEETDIKAYKQILAKEVGEDVLPPAMPEVATYNACSRKKNSLVASVCPVVYRNGKYQFLVSYMVELTSTPAPTTMRKASAVAASRYADNSVLASGRWGKIRVAKTGIHQLTDDVIRKAGFTDLSKVRIFGYGGNLVPEVLTDTYLREHDDLKEIPTCTVAGKKLFYAEGPLSWDSNTATTYTRNPYSDYGYYFITQDDKTPYTVSEEKFLTSFYPHPVDYHYLYEKDEYAWMEGGRKLYEKTPVATSSYKTFSFSLPREDSDAKITISGSGSGKKNSYINLQYHLNDSTLGTQRIQIRNYDDANCATNTWSVRNLKKDNVLKLTNVSASEARLDYIHVTYTTPLPAPSLQNDQFPKAEYVYNITNQNHHADKSCDLVIILPTSQHLRAQAEELKAFHETHDNISVRIVPADELYNEFSSGTPDVSAYRRYMKMLYDRAENEADMPKYLLLFGDCVWDNRLKTSATSSLNPDNLLLCYESDESFSHVDCFVSDDFMALLDDGETILQDKDSRGIPDIGVGRFPVLTAKEASSMVSKIKHYAETASEGDWHNTILFLGDDGNGNIHMSDVNDVADNTIDKYPGYYVRKVMWDAFPRISTSTGNRYPEVTSIITKQQNEGALIIDYSGHGGPNSISHEYVLTTNDFASFKGKNYPLWITASCETMPFDGMATTVGEEAVLNPDGGAIAFFGTTRTVLSNYNKHINKQFMQYVLSRDANGDAVTLGDAVRLTKESLVNMKLDLKVNKLQYTYLGDPALRLALPKYQVVIDSINGIAAGSSKMAQMKAGAIVTVKGHISSQGQKVDEFNGLANIIVRDTKQKVVCKLNDTSKDTGADKAFDYYDRTNILFQGADSVTDGEFRFVFSVPRDINYTDDTGLINVYASSSTLRASANGAFDSFIVGGSETVRNDSIGPSVFCYLNTPSFVNGGSVNTTPFFVAEIMDEDGINSSGSGIGHDLQLTIDGMPSMTYSLNDNFQFDFGSYKSGQTYYVLPALTPGKHSLRFRAWDILNNPTTTTLDFVVLNGQAPELANVYATPAPASDSVTFVVSHDRPGTSIETTVEVMDASGRLLWSNSETSSDTSQHYTYTWNLTLDSGAKLQTGIYLYRVSVRSDDSDYTSKAKKLVVVRRR